MAVAERLERTVRRMDYPPGQKNGRCREVALVEVAVYGNLKKRECRETSSYPGITFAKAFLRNKGLLLGNNVNDIF